MIQLRFSLFRQIKEPLGALVIHFADLESSVTGAINALMGVHGPIGKALESLMPNFFSRIELFHILAMMHTAHPELQTPLPDIISQLKKANDTRNNFIHNSWITATINEDYVLNSFGKARYKAEGGKIREREGAKDITAEAIWDAVDEAFRLSLIIYDWRFRFINLNDQSAWPPPLHDISLRRSPLRDELPDEMTTKSQALPQS